MLKFVFYIKKQIILMTHFNFFYYKYLESLKFGLKTKINIFNIFNISFNFLKLKQVKEYK